MVSGACALKPEEADMRMMVTVTIPVERGSQAVKDGSVGPLMRSTLERIKPESAYFYVENGKRTMRAVFNLANSNDMVPTFEPLMMGLGAEIALTPVMTADELAAGLKSLG